jgi:hypothetical protein
MQQLVAHGLTNRLRSLAYRVVGFEAPAERALEAVECLKP